MCCSDCTEGPLPKPFKRYQGKASSGVDITAIVPGTGGSFSLPPKLIAGVKMSADVLFGFGAGLETEISGEGNWTESECKNGEDCVSVIFDLPFDFRTGVFAELNAKVETCSWGSNYNDCSKQASADAKADSTIQFSGEAKSTNYFGNNCSRSSEVTGYLGRVAYVGQFEYKIEVRGISKTSNFSKEFVFYEGGSL